MPIALNPMPDGTSRTIKHNYGKTSLGNVVYTGSYGATMVAEKLPCADQNVKKQIYKVSDKKIKVVDKKGNVSEYPVELDDGVYLIRKLSPRECFRLTGFTDDDYNKVKDITSKTQLYKQVGNSIVVNTLEAIFSSLGERYKEFKVVE